MAGMRAIALHCDVMKAFLRRRLSPEFKLREKLKLEEKVALAKKIILLFENEKIIMIDSGTTNLEIAKQIN